MHLFLGEGLQDYQELRSARRMGGGKGTGRRAERFGGRLRMSSACRELEVQQTSLNRKGKNRKDKGPVPTCLQGRP